MSAKPDVLLLATGGTVAKNAEGEYLPGEQLVEEIPEISQVADVTVREVASTGSSDMTFENWLHFADEIERAAAREKPPDGIVLTHGSNTVEETAFFLHLAIQTEIPVVLTAAQRHHGFTGNDGDRNLLNAIEVAGHPDSGGRGVLIVINEEIHSARDVTKHASGRPDGWTSRNHGVLGLIDKRGIVEFVRQPEKPHTAQTEFDVSELTADEFPTVEVIFAAVELDGTLMDAAVEHGADGLVMAGFATGTPNRTGQTSAVERAREQGIPVVSAYRGQEGMTTPTETLIWGNTHLPQKARILLMLALMETDDHAEIERMFETY